MVEEIYKPIPDWEGYFVSNYGNVISYRNHKNGIDYTKPHRLKWDINQNGYARVTLYIASKGRKRVQIHRLVGMIFIPNPNNLPCINHIDENGLNNCVDNLEWCTYQYNNNYNGKNKKIGDKLRGRHLSEEHKRLCDENRVIGKVKVRCIDTGELFESRSAAARKYGSAKSARRIADVCRGKYKTAFGLKWEEI